MVFEIIIFLALGGVIVIVGRKLPAVMNSSQNVDLAHYYREKPKIIKPEPELINQPEDKKVDNTDDQTTEETGELDELLRSIDFINETNGDDFWEEPTFFSDSEVQKINEEKVRSQKFSPKIKDVGDYDEVSKTIKVEEKKPEVAEPKEEKAAEEGHPDNLTVKKTLPKTPVGVGLPTNLTIRDLLMQANKSFVAKNYHKAEEFYVKAASQDPNNPRIYSRLGIIYLKQGKYTDAKESLAYSIQLDDASSTQFFNLAIACLHLGDRDSAVGHIKKAISIEPSNQKYQEILNQID